MNSKISKFFLFSALLVSGAFVLVIEIAGVRVLSPFYGSTIFVWSSQIIVALGFLALGYFAGGYLADRLPRREIFYSIIAAGGAISLFLIKASRPILVLSDTFGFKWGPLAASILLFAPPLFLLSMSGPFAIRLLSNDMGKSGKVSGKVFGFSTIGSLTGALLAGFYLIPNFSLSRVFLGSSIFVMMIGLAGLGFERSKKNFLIFFLTAIFSVAIPFNSGYEKDAKAEIIHNEPSFYADLKVIEFPGALSLFMDGAAQSVFSSDKKISISDEHKEIGLIMKKRPDSDILVLGFGVGGVSRALEERHRVDYVELDEKMVELAEKYFDYKKEPNDNIFIEDARSFLRKSEKQYDFIFLDVYKGGMVPLHMASRETFQLIFSRLKPGGMLAGNFIGKKDELLTRSFVKTFKEVFSSVHVGWKMGEEEKSSNFMVYAFNDPAAQPDYGYKLKKAEVDYASGRVITDNKNPVELLSSAYLGGFYDLTKQLFGYQLLFAI